MITEIGPSHETVIYQMIKDVVTTGGATVSVNGAPTPTTGFMVSLEGYERIIPDLPGWVADVSAFLRDNAEILSESDYFLGAWKENENIYLDVSAHINDKKRALWFAAINNRKAIFDIEKGEAVYL